MKLRSAGYCERLGTNEMRSIIPRILLGFFCCSLTIIAAASEESISCYGDDYGLEFGIGKVEEGDYVQFGWFSVKGTQPKNMDIEVSEINISIHKLEMIIFQNPKKKEMFWLSVDGTKGSLRYDKQTIKLECSWNSFHP